MVKISLVFCFLLSMLLSGPNRSKRLNLVHSMSWTENRTWRTRMFTFSSVWGQRVKNLLFFFPLVAILVKSVSLWWCMDNLGTDNRFGVLNKLLLLIRIQPSFKMTNFHPWYFFCWPKSTYFVVKVPNFIWVNAVDIRVLFMRHDVVCFEKSLAYPITRAIPTFLFTQNYYASICSQQSSNISIL